MYKAKDISRTCKSTPKQIKYYIKFGLLPKECINQKGWIDLNDEHVLTLFKIRILKKLEFKLNHIKIFIDNNLNNEILKKMINSYIQERKNEFDIFEKSFEQFSLIAEKSFDKNNFILFNHNNIADFISYRLYEFRKESYKNVQKRNWLRSTRKRMFEQMKGYSINFHNEYQLKMSIFFDKFNNFFKENEISNSPLEIITFFQWLINSPRYKKEFYLLAEGTFCNELYEMLLVWVCKYWK